MTSVPFMAGCSPQKNAYVPGFNAPVPTIVTLPAGAIGAVANSGLVIVRNDGGHGFGLGAFLPFAGGFGLGHEPGTGTFSVTVSTETTLCSLIGSPLTNVTSAPAESTACGTNPAVVPAGNATIGTPGAAADDAHSGPTITTAVATTNSRTAPAPGRFTLTSTTVLSPFSRRQAPASPTS